eukprot:Nk52_evm41s156 gene=Nk52_evmTU41s156
MHIAAQSTPLPKKLLGSCLFVYLAESVSLTVLYPFVAFMVRDFQVAESEEDLGFYVGMIESAFTFCQFLTSGFWGGLSDRIGRRPVLLFGLVGNTIFSVLFGLSPTLTAAIVIRGTNGLVNGNFGVLRVYLREISDKTNQAECFSLLGFFTGVSSVIGPMIGALLANPSESLPAVFSPGSVWDEKPYLLPCVFSGFLSFVALLAAYFLLEETNKVTSKIADEEACEERDDPLLLSDDRRDEIPSLGSVLASRDVFLNIFIYGLLSYLIITLDNVFPIWSVYSVEKNGLGFGSIDIFYVVSIAGAALIFFQMFLFSKLERYLGASLMFRTAALGITLYAFALPFTHNMKEVNIYLFWTCIALLQVFGRGFCVISLFTANAILANNSTTYYLGTVNGAMASIGALSRSFGPFLGGWMLTVSMNSTYNFPFDFHLLYNWLTLTGLLMFFMSLRLRKTLDTVYTPLKKADTDEDEDEELLRLKH